ncbi:MAG: hexapeptide transferase [Betaproteobacteria bacterium]|nr:hexapeptide transferase [Betaproteobacteria bacterium]
MAKKVVILGANDGARIVAYNLSYDTGIEVVGFVDPDASRWGTQLRGKPILGSDDVLPDLFAQGVRHAVVAAGNPKPRARLRRIALDAGFELTNAIHPTAFVSPDVRLGRGVVILAGCVLSDNPSIDDNVWIGLSAVITHDTHVGCDTLIGGRSAVGAEVEIGQRVVIGWGAVVGPRRIIGDDASVGFGSNVVYDIPERAVAVGNPAQVIKYRD